MLALDTPSGVDVDTGLALGAGIYADATLTLALPKIGLLDSNYPGELVVADISVPALIYERLGITVASYLSGAVRFNRCLTIKEDDGNLSVGSSLIVGVPVIGLDHPRPPNLAFGVGCLNRVRSK